MIGISFVVSGWITAVIAGLWVPRGLAEPDPAVSGLRVWALVVTATLLLWLIIALRQRHRSRQLTQYPDQKSAPTPSLSGLRVMAIAALLAFGALGVWAVLGLADQLSKGWAGYSTTVAAVGSAAGALGVLLVLVADLTSSPVPDADRSRRPILIGAVVLPMVVVGASAVVGATVWAPEARLTASTADSTPVPDLPDDLSAVAWHAEMPSQLHQVLAAGTGVIARVDDGVVALDGSTGQERWTYRRDGAVTREISVSPDGRTLVLQWSAGRDGQTQIVFLDAVTGQELHHSDENGSTLFGGYAVPLARNSYVGVDADEGSATGYDLRTGAKLWQYEAPEGCGLVDSFKQSRTNGPMILPVACYDGNVLTSAHFVAFDEGDEPLWERDVPITAEPVAEASSRLLVDVTTPYDGSAFTVRISGSPDPGVAPFGLDFETGEDVPALDSIWTIVSKPWSPDYEVSDNESGAVEVYDKAGDSLGVVATPCSNVNSLTPSDSLIACHLALNIDEAQAGRSQVLVSTYSGEQRTIDVDLGGPYVNLSFDDLAESLVRAPGAWVVWSGEEPAPGEHPVIVGMN